MMYIRLSGIIWPLMFAICAWLRWSDSLVITFCACYFTCRQTIGNFGFDYFLICSAGNLICSFPGIPIRPIKSQIVEQQNAEYCSTLNWFGDFVEHRHLGWRDLNSIYSKFGNPMCCLCLNILKDDIEGKDCWMKVSRMWLRRKYNFAIGFWQIYNFSSW